MNHNPESKGLSRPGSALFGLLLGVVLLGPGCASWRLWITVRTSPDTNQGRPLQLLIRSVSTEHFRDETYADLTQLVLVPDKTVLRLLILEPSDTRRLFLSVPKDKPLAFYLFFGTTTGSWKMLLPPPHPWSVRIPLGRNGVIVSEVKECRLGRNLP